MGDLSTDWPDATPRALGLPAGHFTLLGLSFLTRKMGLTNIHPAYQCRRENRGPPKTFSYASRDPVNALADPEKRTLRM